VYSWFKPVRAEFDENYYNFYCNDLGLGGVNKLDVVFATVRWGLQRTVFFINHQPLLNPDGSVYILEWEAGPGIMATHTIELLDLLPVGMNYFYAITIPIENTEYYDPIFSQKLNLTLNGRSRGFYGNPDSYEDY